MTGTNATPIENDDRYRRIWTVVAGIPSGSVLNYGEVARLAGMPGRARLVGRALGRAPKSMALPWHRVVNAQGAISFKPGSGPYRVQREKLESEGVEFVEDRIDLERYSPEQALDRMLWGPPGDPA
ncbi:methylated-DNA--[protein]-cysteine S-methyltransferase [Wenzhouxiangella sp. XN79A]|uniref:MGMT family protein n=1 Tax=Wenzhouxiangella sp. XN79A TaxID=2724193 RepID=UPI00321706EB